MALAASVLTTPFGALTVIVESSKLGDRSAPAAGAVVASGFRPLQREEEPLADRTDPLLELVAAAVRTWADGSDVTALDRVPVWVPEAGFRAAVWAAMRSVPAGSVVSYADLAGLAGNRRAARAAGSACATNPVAPFIPCHRIVRSGGQTGRYGYGDAVKRAILGHEGAREARSNASMIKFGYPQQ